MTISTAGAVLQDVRINGSLTINANNVTVRRVEVINGNIENFAGSVCRTGLLLEDVSIIRTTPSANAVQAVGTGGYTARRVKIDGMHEGFRVGGKSSCGPVTVEDSFVSIRPPSPCGDWHGDGLQGYDGGAVTVRNMVILMDETGCGGTAPWFYPSGQGNTSVDIDGLVVSGGGASFRNGMPGTVRNLHVVDGEWGYFPVDVNCSALTVWQADIVTLDAQGQPVFVRTLTCSGSGT